ncbi:MAG: hypothetical protein KatS3mg076_2872 [Candidatus Binatia bacterium]|nr:MAG: hypothetical protein KatS3mg076_2872 [Candidatus Binatia bacterium]
MAELVGGYTTREVARLTGLTPTQVRLYARWGILRGVRRTLRTYRYSFHDLLVLRAAKRLRDAGLPWQRIRRAFVTLRRAGVEPPGVSLVREGKAILALARRRRWRVEDGQLLFDFATGQREPARVIFFSPGDRPLTGREWYNIGVEQESVSVERAIEAYRLALRHAPGMAEAHINLGRLLHLRGECEAAREHYARAMRLDPLDPIAAFNLGVVLEDLGRPLEAIRMYRNALRRDPRLADAHYNLALLYERNGKRSEARRHFLAYRKLQRARAGEPEE